MVELPHVEVEAPKVEPIDEAAALRAQLAALQARLAQLEAAPAPQVTRMAATVAPPVIERPQVEAGVSARLPGAEEAARIAAEMAALKPARRVEVVTPAAAVEDNLEVIEGIGPAYARRLRQLGITSFAALAEASDDVLLQVAGPFGERVHREDWRGQARRLSQRE